MGLPAGSHSPGAFPRLPCASLCCLLMSSYRGGPEPSHPGPATPDADAQDIELEVTDLLEAGERIYTAEEERAAVESAVRNPAWLSVEHSPPAQHWRQCRRQQAEQGQGGAGLGMGCQTARLAACGVEQSQYWVLCARLLCS
jgi:hypothetical protein